MRLSPNMRLDGKPLLDRGSNLFLILEKIYWLIIKESIYHNYNTTVHDTDQNQGQRLFR